MAKRLTRVSVARRGRVTGELLVVTAFDGEGPHREGLPEGLQRRVEAVVRGLISWKSGRVLYGSGEEGGGVGAVAVHGLGRRDEWEWMDAERWFTNLIAECRRTEARRLVLVPPDHPAVAGREGIDHHDGSVGLVGRRRVAHARRRHDGLLA